MKTVRIKLQDITQVHDFITSLCDIWIDTKDWDWEFTVDAKISVRIETQDQDYVWEKSDLMNLCPTSISWVEETHTWNQDRYLPPHQQLPVSIRPCEPPKKIQKLRAAAKPFVPASKTGTKVFQVQTPNLIREPEGLFKVCKKPHLISEDNKENIGLKLKMMTEESTQNIMKSSSNQPQKTEPKIQTYSTAEIVKIFKNMGNFGQQRLVSTENRLKTQASEDKGKF